MKTTALLVSTLYHDIVLAPLRALYVITTHSLLETFILALHCRCTENDFEGDASTLLINALLNTPWCSVLKQRAKNITTLKPAENLCPLQRDPYFWLSLAGKNSLLIDPCPFHKRFTEKYSVENSNPCKPRQIFVVSAKGSANRTAEGAEIDGYKRVVTQKRAGVAVLVCWAVASIVGFIPMLGWNNLQKINSTDLLITCQFENVISMEYMVYFNFFGWVLPPLLLMLLIYTEIFCMIRKQLAKKVSASASDPSKYYHKELRLAKSLALVLFLFAVSWLPLHVLNCVTLFFLVCWAVASIVGFTPMLGWNNLQKINSTDLLITCQFENVISMEYMVYFNFFGWVLPPLLLMLLIYTEIFCMIRKQLAKKVSASASDPSKYYHKELRLAKSLALVLFLFAVSWLPLHVLNCVTLFCPSCKKPMVLTYTAIFLSHGNSAVNPIIYAFRIRKFRTAFSTIWRHYFCCKKTPDPENNFQNEKTDNHADQNAL
ncbi:AA1R protein, partial [Polyodon spathula]|nr:AA1R protein [Polyodon spathula]